jgi:hypothetical protein
MSLLTVHQQYHVSKSPIRFRFLINNNQLRVFRPILLLSTVLPTGQTHHKMGSNFSIVQEEKKWERKGDVHVINE